MAAYVISDVEVIDPALFEKYRSSAQAAIAKCGGRYVVRGGLMSNASRIEVKIVATGAEAAHPRGD